MKRLGVVVAVLAAALGGAVLVRRVVQDDRPPLVIIHWSNSHPMREGLLPAMAERFNDEDHETASGQRIEVAVVSCDSAKQATDLVARAKGSGPAEVGCTAGGEAAAAPTIVTPQSADWLVDMVHRSGSEIVDVDGALPIAETWLGIVTYRAMAECLGWPDVDLGYADILALAADPEGWAAYDCAPTEWGSQPLLAFTNPSTSTSGRNVLVSLYSIAAGKPPGELTVADIERPEVRQYVKDFQQLVDHYQPGTIPMNTRIVQGTRSGHFFLMPEDNLVSLATGKEEAFGADGRAQPVPAVDGLVMIYPKEGSVLNSNPAAIVDASWVTADETAAAGEWVEFLRAEAQQQEFMAAGFRPAAGTGVALDPERFSSWGLDASKPTATIQPGTLQPDVLTHIIDSWGAVKKPAIVTFVVDTSGSMEGEPLEQVKDGLTRLLDAIGTSAGGGNESQVGLVTFSTEVDTVVPPAPHSTSRFHIGDAIAEMEAVGDTALYDAIGQAIAVTDAAAGDPRATRAVIVLSDGAATAGRCLDSLVTMTTDDEEDVSSFCAIDDARPRTASGPVTLPDVRGVELLPPLDHDVQVFFVGFGTAEMDIGRILAEATGAEFQGSTDADLAAVIEELGGYF